MRVIFIRPTEGKRCPMPVTTEHGPLTWLPSEGTRVRLSSYWQRRVIEGVVEVIAPPAAPAQTPDSEG